MNETPDDLRRLQALLDRSYGTASRHLLDIHVPRARLAAGEVAARLTGMQVFVVATTTADGRPLTAPVDAFLHRGDVVFGTAPSAVRARHLTKRPAVSATHVRGETLVVTVHGQAEGFAAADDESFLAVLRAQYGAVAADELATGAYFRIHAERMFAADLSVHTAAA